MEISLNKDKVYTKISHGIFFFFLREKAGKRFFKVTNKAAGCSQELPGPMLSYYLKLEGAYLKNLYNAHGYVWIQNFYISGFIL